MLRKEASPSIPQMTNTSRTSVVNTRERRKLGRFRPRTAITHLVLLPVCFLWIYPFLWMVSASLKTQREI